jgi:hypothetical protein
LQVRGSPFISELSKKTARQALLSHGQSCHVCRIPRTKRGLHSLAQLVIDFNFLKIKIKFILLFKSKIELILIFWKIKNPFILLFESKIKLIIIF